MNKLLNALQKSFSFQKKLCFFLCSVKWLFFVVLVVPVVLRLYYI